MSLGYRMDLAFELPPLQATATKPIHAQKPSMEKSDRPTESSVTCIYQAMLVGSLRNIAITWSRVSDVHTIAITIENLSNDDHQTCQIEFKSCQYWSRKGLKSLHVDNERVDIFWDFRAAEFSTNPEPCSDYYVAIVFDKEVVLLLGDSETEAYKRTKSRPSPTASTLTHKEEILCGYNCFHTKIMLDEGSKEHNIVIEKALMRLGEPELRITIDERMLVRVMNLNWRFRSNETALVNNVPVQIFWDVHDWLFSNPGSGHGLFIFKPGSLKKALLDDGGYYGADESPSTAGCCHFVFACNESSEENLLVQSQ